MKLTRKTKHSGSSSLFSWKVGEPSFGSSQCTMVDLKNLCFNELTGGVHSILSAGFHTLLHSNSKRTLIGRRSGKVRVPVTYTALFRERLFRIRHFSFSISHLIGRRNSSDRVNFAFFFRRFTVQRTEKRASIFRQHNARINDAII